MKKMSKIINELITVCGEIPELKENKTKKRLFNFYIDENVLEQVKYLAKERNIHVSQYLREMLNNAINEDIINKIQYR